MKKKLLIVFALALVLVSVLSVTVFAQTDSVCQGCEVCNPTQDQADGEMKPMKIKFDGKAFIESLGLMGQGMLGIFVVTLVIIGVVAILNWHGKSLEDRQNKNK
ncbi:MAG: hypothetical protein J6B29_00920 [Clostridia bacterium]|nr:hypothetical protein [Clostridia bacterium]